jgi:hypothetical protein
MEEGIEMTRVLSAGRKSRRRRRDGSKSSRNRARRVEALGKDEEGTWLVHAISGMSPIMETVL